jgi:hypothetical protein
MGRRELALAACARYRAGWWGRDGLDGYGVGIEEKAMIAIRDRLWFPRRSRPLALVTGRYSLSPFIKIGELYR